MATFSIETTKEEQDAVVSAIHKTKAEGTVSMSRLAEVSGVGKNRVRYVITDLLDKNRIRQISTKHFNEHYKRFRYEVC